ncbi:MAG: TerB family tellurite resistance protein [Bacteroidota bacterium]
MIIFGTRSVKFTKEQGQFHCPQCETQRDYKHKSARRFFTLYFIPLIPLDKLGEYVECRTCKGTFIPKVLEYQKSASADNFLSEYEKALKHSLVLMMLADGEIDDREMEVVLKVFNKFSHHDVTMPELEAYVSDVQRNPQHVATYLRGVAPRLNGHGKEMVIKCALSVAAADNHIDDSEIALLQEMAQAMEMTPSHLKGIMSEMMEPQGQAFSPN